MIDDYEMVMRRMVEKQKELIAAGGDIKQITNASIKREEGLIEMTPEPVPVLVQPTPVKVRESIFS